MVDYWISRLGRVHHVVIGSAKQIGVSELLDSIGTFSDRKKAI